MIHVLILNITMNKVWYNHTRCSSSDIIAPLYDSEEYSEEYSDDETIVLLKNIKISKNETERNDTIIDLIDSNNIINELFELLNGVLDNPEDKNFQTKFKSLIMNRHLNDIMTCLINHSYPRTKEILSKSYQVFEEIYFPNK
jgi:hypothetical protein